MDRGIRGRVGREFEVMRRLRLFLSSKKGCGQMDWAAAAGLGLVARSRN